MKLHPFTEVDVNPAAGTLQHDRTSGLQHVNDARKELFLPKGKDNEETPFNPRCAIAPVETCTKFRRLGLDT